MRVLFWITTLFGKLGDLPERLSCFVESGPDDRADLDQDEAIRVFVRPTRP